MDLDQAAWVVHRHVVDPRLDELDICTATTDFGHAPMVPIELPRDLWGLDTLALEGLALQTRSLLAATGEVTSDR